MKLGLSGYTGNKGAVCNRFEYLNSSICIINCHLAAHKANVKNRNKHVREILNQTIFNIDNRELKIYEHDFVFWVGDLNYRLQGIPSNLLREMIEKQKFKELLQYDQLSGQQNTEKILQDFLEANIHFPPTYKFNKGTSNYK